ncbi:putative sporulation protein (polysaccharide deacetylase family) [Salirhabdus euzebyi]|uniref:Putative sporulation protein (Polysaccharide deacetylase family) n=1 Tax=Salirhabdus euzebyi TaxID=394506 RepID=A0A841Q3A9_9BACI|nr:polysaccharide deacetylase family protein [Salirhabdus euzebyi]MBB6452874.1 putative sporulation protein (polysaccharide deacetylase family) [Salirhabdus euzebyi]
MKKQHFMHLCLFITLVIVSLGVVENPFTEDYVSVMKNVTVTAVNTEDPLYQELEQKAKEYEKEPHSAKIDKVWKKMPGLNGLKVDISKSYAKMKKKGKFDEKLLVYKQIEPEVKLKDLPAAPIFRGNPNKQMVSFLINVSWGEEYIPDMLKVLKQHNVKATFFIDGAWAQKNVELLKMVKEQGHEIGSHGYNHPNMSRLGENQIHEQVTKTNEIINSILDVKPTLFAPPAGNFTNQVVEIVHSHKMETILWTLDTIDWKKPTKSVLLGRVIPKLEPGAMILMHPTEVTKESLSDLILKIKEKKYKIGTVSKLLDEERQ